MKQKPSKVLFSKAYKQNQSNTPYPQGTNMNSNLKSLIVVHSYHHNNTQKIAQAMAKTLEAKVKSPKETNPQELNQYDLIGFGAGIDSGKHYRELIEFVDSLPQNNNRKAFIFSTSGVTGEKKRTKDHSTLRIKTAS